MVDVSSDFLRTFLVSPLGIMSQAAIFVATIYPFIKWINKRLDDRIDKHINDKIKPAVSDLCKQLEDMSHAMKDFKRENIASREAFEAKTNTAIKYIDRAIMHLQGEKDDKEIAQYKEDS